MNKNVNFLLFFILFPITTIQSTDKLPVQETNNNHESSETNNNKGTDTNDDNQFENFFDFNSEKPRVIERPKKKKTSWMQMIAIRYGIKVYIALEATYNWFATKYSYLTSLL